MTTAAPVPAFNVYLAKEGGELVLHQGVNPLANKHADKRILILGGGVTGLTVSVTFDFTSSLHVDLDFSRPLGHFWMLAMP